MKKKFICTVCGYVHEGDTPPEKCPQCHVPASKFKELVESAEGLSFVTEHEIGVAKGCDAEMIKDLNAHFTGECTEVGMYLAMSRQADREGYPEIAEAYKRLTQYTTRYTKWQRTKRVTAKASKVFTTCLLYTSPSPRD